MELYIRIKDGQPFEHPILGNNFREAFPHIDVNNLPEEFMKFEKLDVSVGLYQVFTEMPYFIEDGVCKNGIKRDMTPTEKEEKIQQLKDRWIGFGGFPSWIFNENNGEFDPPKIKPMDGKNYRWNEDILNWIEVA